MDVTSFEVSTSELDDGMCAVEVRGELDLETTPALERVIDGLNPEELRGLLIDLSKCEFIDSTGVALLVKTWRRLDTDEDSQRLVLCCPTDQVRKVIEITGLTDSMAVFRDRNQAHAALAN